MIYKSIMAIIIAFTLSACTSTTANLFNNANLTPEGKKAVMIAIGVKGTKPPTTMTSEVEVPVLPDREDFENKSKDETIIIFIDYSKELKDRLLEANAKLSTIEKWDGSDGVIIDGSADKSVIAGELVGMLIERVSKTPDNQKIKFVRDNNETK